MKGKKLYHLISALDKSERHSVINFCKTSADRRRSLLADLIKKRPKTESQFESHLEHVGSELGDKKMGGKERDQTLRRFVDFAVRDIENVKLKEYLMSDTKQRNYLLSLIYDGAHPQLNEGYIKKAKAKADEEGDFWIATHCLEQELVRTLQSQRKKEYAASKGLLVEKNKLLQEFYHNKLAGIYNRLSSLYLDDKEIAGELKNLLLEEEEIEALIRISRGKIEAVEYKIAQARFHFEDEGLYRRYIAEASELLSGVEGTARDIDILQRRINFQQVLAAMHFGDDWETVLSYAERVMEVSIRYDFPDSLTMFYILFARLNLGEVSLDDEDLVEAERKYFQGDSAYMYQFIEACILYQSEEWSKAGAVLSEMAYAPNFYVGLWSRLLELAVHYRKGNVGYCESLLQRTNRLLSLNPEKVFTMHGNAMVLMEIHKGLDINYPKFLSSLLANDVETPSFHRALVASISF